MYKKHLMAKTVHNPIVTKVVSMPKPEHTIKNVEEVTRKVNNKEPVTPCLLCEENKPLQELFDNDKKICDHSMCKKCIRKIIDSDTTEVLPRCPYCQNGFSQFGFPKKNVSDYYDRKSTLIDDNPYPKGSMMHSFFNNGGKTRRRRLRRRRTNKRK
jgi:hypothetical protein